MTKPYWSAVQAVAWIVTRDLAVTEAVLREDTIGAVEKKLAGSGRASSPDTVTVREGLRQLIAECARGKITMYGTRDVTHEMIERYHWAELLVGDDVLNARTIAWYPDPIYPRDRASLRKRPVPRVPREGALWHSLRLSSHDVQKLWTSQRAKVMSNPQRRRSQHIDDSQLIDAIHQDLTSRTHPSIRYAVLARDKKISGHKAEAMIRRIQRKYKERYDT